jgi:hypothetical protein
LTTNDRDVCELWTEYLTWIIRVGVGDTFSSMLWLEVVSGGAVLGGERIDWKSSLTSPKEIGVTLRLFEADAARTMYENLL